MGDFVRPAGGLPAAAKALLVPENIRAGVHIKGGGVDVVGNICQSVGAWWLKDNTNTGWTCGSFDEMTKRIAEDLIEVTGMGTLKILKSFACRIVVLSGTNEAYPGTCGVRVLKNGASVLSHTGTTMGTKAVELNLISGDILTVQVYRPSYYTTLGTIMLYRVIE